MLKKRINSFGGVLLLYLLSTFIIVLLETLVLSLTKRLNIGVSYIDLVGLILSIFWLTFSFRKFRNTREKSWLIISLGSWLMLFSFGLSAIFNFVYSLYSKGYPTLEYASYIFPGLVLFNKYDKPVGEESMKLISNDVVFFFPGLILFIVILIATIISYFILNKNGKIEK